jgi:hypothetical protein
MPTFDTKRELQRNRQVVRYEADGKGGWMGKSSRIGSYSSNRYQRGGMRGNYITRDNAYRRHTHPIPRHAHRDAWGDDVTSWGPGMTGNDMYGQSIPQNIPGFRRGGKVRGRRGRRGRR